MRFIFNLGRVNCAAIIFTFLSTEGRAHLWKRQSLETLCHGVFFIEHTTIEEGYCPKRLVKENGTLILTIQELRYSKHYSSTCSSEW